MQPRLGVARAAVRAAERGRGVPAGTAPRYFAPAVGGTGSRPTPPRQALTVGTSILS